ncbi:MAG: hypothetical protein ACOX6H_02585 [Christensenellales bacterium]|jgi:hypothetical protein
MSTNHEKNIKDLQEFLNSEQYDKILLNFEDFESKIWTFSKELFAKCYEMFFKHFNDNTTGETLYPLLVEFVSRKEITDSVQVLKQYINYNLALIRATFKREKQIAKQQNGFDREIK